MRNVWWNRRNYYGHLTNSDGSTLVWRPRPRPGQATTENLKQHSLYYISADTAMVVGEEVSVDIRRCTHTQAQHGQPERERILSTLATHTNKFRPVHRLAMQAVSNKPRCMPSEMEDSAREPRIQYAKYIRLDRWCWCSRAPLHTHRRSMCACIVVDRVFSCMVSSSSVSIFQLFTKRSIGNNGPNISARFSNGIIVSPSNVFSQKGNWEYPKLFCYERKISAERIELFAFLLNNKLQFVCLCFGFFLDNFDIYLVFAVRLSNICLSFSFVILLDLWYLVREFAGENTEMKWKYLVNSIQLFAWCNIEKKINKTKE